MKVPLDGLKRVSYLSNFSAPRHGAQAGRPGGSHSRPVIVPERGREGQSGASVPRG
jgi:hypothetical protein